MKQIIIIFDLDGVLVDSTKISMQSILDHYPTMTEDKYKEILAGNFRDELDKFKLVNNYKQETPEEAETRRALYSKRKLRVPLYDGIVELVESLHSLGHTLVVNTSALERNTRPLLEKTNIVDYFDFIATAELSKNKTEKFDIIKNRYKALESDMLFITDTLGDIREADAAHVPTVAVTWGAHGVAYFKREPHDNLIAIVDSVDELKRFIKYFYKTK